MEKSPIMRVTTYLSPDERRALRLLAVARDTTVADVVRRLIQKELAK